MCAEMRPMAPVPRPGSASAAAGMAAPGGLATCDDCEHLPPAATGGRCPVPVIAAGGMPGWQITLIAVGAALVGGAVAILADRSWTARKAHATITA